MKATKVRLVRSFVHTCWDVFDHLGYWMAVNFISCLSFLLILPIPFALVGLLNSQKRILEGKKLSVRLFLKDARQYGPKAFLLFILHLGVLGLGVLNSLFYHTYFLKMAFFFDLLILFFEILIGSILLFCYPLILVGHSIKNCLKLGFVLSIKHLSKIAIASFFIALFIFICSISVVGVFVFMLAAICSFWENIFDQIRRIEGEKEERPLPEKTFKEVFFPFN